MALDLGQIRGELATQIQSKVARDVRVYNGYIPDSPVPPCVIVGPDIDTYISYHETYSQTGMAIVHFRVTVITPPGPGADGQIVLDEFLSAGIGNTSSVLDAIMADRTLGGSVSDCRVRGVEHLGRISLSELLDQQIQGDAAAVLFDVYTHRN